MTGEDGLSGPILSVQGVSKSFPNSQALESLSVAIHSGERVALAGPSGSGKTTLLYLMAGLLQPDRGELSIDGYSLAKLTPGKQLSSLVGLVHQQYDLVPHLLVVHNVLAGRLGQWSLWRSLASLVWPQERHLAETALALMGIGDKINERTSHLSGGEQQRVAIARLMVQSPKVVLADEPVASLDPALSEEMLGLLTELTSQANRTLVVSLHSPYLIKKYCSRVLGLREGRLIFDIPSAQLTEPVLDQLYNLKHHAGEAAAEVS